MAALLVTIAAMSVMLSVAMPTWRHLVQREKEAELVFRGEQYARAIELFQRKYAGAFPPSLDVLIEQRFLRKKYRDPMVEDGEFRLLYQSMAAATVPGQVVQAGGAGTAPLQTGRGPTGPESPAPASPSPGGRAAPIGGPVGPQGGIVGVISKSTETSIRLYNGRSKYNEWEFVYTPVTNQPGVQGSPVPGRTPGQPSPGDGRTPPGVGGMPFPSPGQPPGGSSRR